MEKKFIDSTYIFRKFVNRALRTMRSTLMLLLRRLFLSLHRCLVSYRRFHLLLHCLHLIKANNIPLLITFYSLAHIALASFSLSRFLHRCLLSLNEHMRRFLVHKIDENKQGYSFDVDYVGSTLSCRKTDKYE